MKKVEKCDRVGQRRETVGSMLKEDTINLYKNGMTQSEIAELAKVSRERIRQVFKKFGMTAKSPFRKKIYDERSQERKRKIQEQRSSRRAERQKIYEEKVDRWSKLWSEGHTLRQMGELLGISRESVGIQLVILRKKEPELFPRRRIVYESKPPRHLRQMWASGMTIDDIAKKCGKTYNQICYSLAAERQKHGVSAYPYHCQYCDEYSQQPTESNEGYAKRIQALLRPLRRGWAEWKTIRSLAEDNGIPVNRIYPLVIMARSRFGWFPKRDLAQRKKSVLRTEFKEANNLWKDGLSGPEIAKRVGISLDRLHDKVLEARKAFGQSWFPRRSPTKDEKHKNLLSLSEMWKSGLSTKDIALKIGIQHMSLSCKICAHRKKFGDELFPRRRAL